MNQRALCFSLGLGALAWALPLGGCGDYTADPAPLGAGGGGKGGTAASGSPAVGGSSGSSGSPASGGATGGGGSGSGGRTEPPPATCEDVVACGGDVAAVWFATSSCLPVTGKADISDFGIGCPEAAVTSGKLEVTGNWTLGADGKISDNTSTTGMVVLEMEPPCLNISGTVSTCDRLSAPLSSVGFSDLKCVDSTVTTGGCTCTGTIDQKGSMGLVSFNAATTGKYTVAANKLSVSSGDKPEYDYCVKADILTATLKTKNNIGQVNGTVVFQKQP